MPAVLTKAEELFAVQAELARRTLLGFTVYTFPDYDVNWHHRVLAQHLDAVLSGQIKRLMVFLPPQTGKTELLSRRFPAYALGKQPDLRIIAATYGSDWADRISRDVQKIIDSPEYGQLFPGTRLASARDTEVRNVDKFEVVGRRGFYLGVGVGEAVTGHTAQLAIIDDPVKDREQAESLVYRERAWNWYTDTFFSRRSSAAVPVILTMTRWHEDDLAGRLMRLSEESDAADQWTVLCLPALAEQQRHQDDPREPGESLWPDRYPVEEYDKRRAQSEYGWASLYQQRPAPAEGGLIKRLWWQWYPRCDTQNAPLPPVSEIVISVDTATKAKETNDEWAVGVWGLNGASVYGLNAEKGHWDLPKCLERIHGLYGWCQERWPDVMPTVLVEYTAAGPDVVNELKRSISSVVPESPKGDKLQRVHGILPVIEGKSVFLPGRCFPDGRVDVSASPSWVSPFVEECASFPVGTADNQVDQMTQALKRLARPRQSFGMMHAGWL